MNPTSRPSAKSLGGIYSTPLAVWVTLFFVGPMLLVLVYSFLTRAVGGGVEWTFSLESYAAIFEPRYLRILAYTLFMAVIATVLTIIVALPCAYYMARHKNTTLLMALVVIPFWVNFIIRIYAWTVLLGTNGIVNAILIGLGIVAPDNGIQFLYNDYAVLIVLVYTNLPFAILPLYSTIEKFDFGLLEAARDLGASHLRSLRSVLLPNIRSGIITAVLFTFIPIFGTFAVPDIMGNSSTFMLGQLINDKMRITGNLPFASAESVLIMILTMIGMTVYLYVTNRMEKQRVVQEDEP